jgi:hypothetical protein
MDSNDPSRPYERTEEEVAWDAEFGTPGSTRDNNVTGFMADVARFAIQVPVALVQMPMALLPNDTSRHARSALREGFLAVRSLLGAIGDGIENLLAEPSSGRRSTVAGPPGTWGTGRQSQTLTTPGKVKRIEVQDEVPESGGSRIVVEGDDTGTEGRGLRADIEY